MQLYLVRHAIAFERDATRWPDDGERPLTPEGEDRFRKAVRGLRKLVPTVEVSLASPFVRAWRTAEILQEEAGWPAPVRCDALRSERPTEEAIRAIREYAASASVAAVGHEPNHSELASALLAGSKRLVGMEIKKGGVVALATDPDVRPGRSYLRWAIPPKVLRSLAG